MKKVSIKAKVEYTSEGARSEAVFKDTKESAGYLAGWSGEYLAVRLNGEKKTFAKKAEAVNFLETQEEKMESSIIISKADYKKISKVTGESQGKKPTKAQLRKWGVIK